MAALNRIRVTEGDLSRAQEQLEEEEENRNNMQRQIAGLQQQVRQRPEYCDVTETSAESVLFVFSFLRFRNNRVKTRQLLKIWKG